LRFIKLLKKVAQFAFELYIFLFFLVQIALTLFRFYFLLAQFALAFYRLKVWLRNLRLRIKIF